MADLNFTLGLQADALISGATQAVRALDGMNKTAQGLSKKLLEQNTLLKGGEEALMRYRIENAKLTTQQRAAMLALHNENVAIKERAQAQQAAAAAEKAAAAQRVAAAKEWQAEFDKQEAERKKEAQVALNAEKTKRAAIQQTIAAMKAEAAAMGHSAAQQKLYELRVQGATQAQLKQAAAAQAQIAAQNRVQSGLMGGGSMGALAMGAIGFGSASGVLKAADDWTVFQNRLKLVTQSSEELKTAQEGVLAIAKRTGQDLGSTAQVYQRLAANQKALNLNGTQLLSITETINKSIVVGGSTAEGAAAALTQFGQAMASGVLRGEEFNSVMEQAPGLAQALATGLGVGVGQLRAMANNGELTATVVTRALEKAGGSVAAQFAKMDLTIAQSAQIFKTNLTEFIGTSSEAGNVANTFSRAIRLAAEHIDILAAGVGVLVAISMTKWLVSGVASTVQYGASVLLLASNAGTAAGANATLAASVNAVGARAALASFQVTGFSGSLAVLRTAAVATVAPLWALVAPLAPFAAGAAAVAGSITALSAAYKFAKGEDASNWISDGFDGLLDKMGVLDSKTESLGTKLYDWLHPIDEANAKLQKTQQIIAKAEAQSGYQSLAAKIQNAGGAAQYEAQNTSLADLKKSLDESVLKYQKQSDAIGKSTIELEQMRLEAQKQQALIKAEKEFREQYRNQDNVEQLVRDSLTKTAADWDKSIASVVSNMKQTETATKARTEAEKAQTAALERARAVQDSLQGLQADFERVGKTAQEIKLMDLKDKGATDAQLAQAKAILEATAAKEAAFKANQEKLDNASSGFQSAADTMQKAADKMGGDDGNIIDRRYKELMAKANAYNVERNATYKTPLESLKVLQEQQATAQTLAAQSLTQAGNAMQQAAHTFQVAVTTPTIPTTQATQPQDMGRVTLDLRAPNGNVLTGVLFGSKTFLEQFKSASYQHIEGYINEMHAAVRA